MTVKASFRFYEELNEYLPPSRRKLSFEQRFEAPCSIGKAIEALGVPTTEVDLVLAELQFRPGAALIDRRDEIV